MQNLHGLAAKGGNVARRCWTRRTTCPDRKADDCEPGAASLCPESARRQRATVVIQPFVRASGPLKSLPQACWRNRARESGGERSGCARFHKESLIPGQTRPGVARRGGAAQGGGLSVQGAHLTRMPFEDRPVAHSALPACFPAHVTMQVWWPQWTVIGHRSPDCS
jgi:hypothetical protein